MVDRFCERHVSNGAKNRPNGAGLEMPAGSRFHTWTLLRGVGNRSGR